MDVVQSMINGRRFPNPKYYPELKEAYDYLDNKGFIFLSSSRSLNIIFACGWTYMSLYDPDVDEHVTYFFENRMARLYISQLKKGDSFIFKSHFINDDFIVDTSKHVFTYPLPDFYVPNQLGKLELDCNHPIMQLLHNIIKLIYRYERLDYSHLKLYNHDARQEQIISQILEHELELMQRSIQFYRDKMEELKVSSYIELSYSKNNKNKMMLSVHAFMDGGLDNYRKFKRSEVLSKVSDPEVMLYSIPNFKNDNLLKYLRYINYKPKISFIRVNARLTGCDAQKNDIFLLVDPFDPKTWLADNGDYIDQKDFIQ
jgi:hypothetical protein